jgi:hypothetical protein
MELAGLGSIQPYAFVGVYVKPGISCIRTISALARDAWLSLILIYESFRFGTGSFEPPAPEPEVAHQLAKGAKEKSETQGNEEYGEREDEMPRPL